MFWKEVWSFVWSKIC